MIGDCKDSGKDSVNSEDIVRLKRGADALPRKRIDTFIVSGKLSPFTRGEIELARTLNEQYRRRVILFTAGELEPYHLYERTKLKFKDINEYASRPEDLAGGTAQIYFKL